jgi:hypothetical protein
MWSLLDVTATVVEAAAVAQVKTIQQPVEPHHLQGKDLQVAVERNLRDLAAAEQGKLENLRLDTAAMEKQVLLLAQVLLVAVAAVVVVETIVQYRWVTVALVVEEEVAEVLPDKLESQELITLVVEVVEEEVAVVHYLVTQEVPA